MTQSVRHTVEVERILALPRRRLEDIDLGKLTMEMTELLRTPNGTQTLKPMQALALYEGGTLGGGFFPLSVGNGKSLISLLMAYVLDAQTPILAIPAALVRKTIKEIDEYSKNWRIPDNLRIESYEMLGLVQGADILDSHEPDLLIFDEAHKLKGHKAARTRRVARYLKEHPETKVVAMSGTIMRRSLLDFGHILRWCLKGNAPIPETQNELEDWANALDEGVEDWNRFEPGALVSVPFGGGETVEDARRNFRARLTETPGVVATQGEGERVDCSLLLRARPFDVSTDTDAHFHRLRTKWELPDGWEPDQATDIWRHAKELALGLYYKWDPRPPDDWRHARREWAAFVRQTLSYSRTLDSELQVVNACDAGKLDSTALEAWRAVRDSFKPNTVAVRFDDSALRRCLKWMKEGPGIVWTHHKYFAQWLAEVSGCKYYGPQGLAEDGSFIDNASPKDCVIASIKANKEGRNLQRLWSRMLFTSAPDGADECDQAIGRLHRPGQEADEVVVDVLLGCKEHVAAWRKARSAAQTIRDTTGAESKLLLADMDWPSEQEIDAFSGARWS